MHELGKTIWADDHPGLYGEALDFEALANVKSNELLLYDDDATEPFGGVVCTLAEYTEHGVLLDTGGEKLTAVDRDELEEEAGIWRLKTDGLPETDGIETLGLDEKTLNRLHKNCPEINTIEKLIGTMYLPNAFEKISTPDMKRIESALKKTGIIKYMRGDWVEESDIDPEPLTWDELHDYVGKLLVHDCSTESQRCLKLVWIYKIEDSGDTCLSYLDGGTSFSNTRKGYINGDKKPLTPNLAHEGQFFVLKSQRLRTAENAEEMPMKEPETVPMLTEKQQAEALHKQITGYGEVIYQSLYGMCTAIKQMRDSKLYKALGFDTFEAYTEEKLGMKRRQAYTYISIADKLSADFVQSTAQIGIQKLYLLAMAPEEARAEITQTVDLESTTVRELREQITQLAADRDELAADRQREGLRADRLAREAKEKDAQIAALQNQNEDAEKSRADAEERAKKWYERASEEKQKGEEMLADCKRYWNGRAHEMEARIKDLEQRPVDVAMDETAADRIKALNEELMQKKAEAAIARVRADAKAQEAADAVRAEYEQKIAEMQAQKQETKPDSSLVFEAFMANAVKSIELLVDFLSAYRDDENHPQFVAEFDAFMARVADEVAGI